jgi:hypothetical protein
MKDVLSLSNAGMMNSYKYMAFAAHLGIDVLGIDGVRD